MVKRKGKASTHPFKFLYKSVADLANSNLQIRSIKDLSSLAIKTAEVFDWK